MPESTFMVSASTPRLKKKANRPCRVPLTNTARKTRNRGCGRFRAGLLRPRWAHACRAFATVSGGKAGKGHPQGSGNFLCAVYHKLLNLPTGGFQIKGPDERHENAVLAIDLAHIGSGGKVSDLPWDATNTIAILDKPNVGCGSGQSRAAPRLIGAW